MGPRQISTITSPALNLSVFDCRNGRPLGEEHARGTGQAVHAVRIHHRRIDGRALDHRAARREIARGKADGRGQAAGGGRFGIENDVVRIDTVACAQLFAQARAALRPFPPVEHLAQRCAGYREYVGPQQPGLPEVEHRLRNRAGEKHLHRGMIARAVGKAIDDARRFAIDARPVRGGRLAQTGRVRDGWKVQQQIGGSAEGRVQDHGVLERRIGEDVAHAQAARCQRLESARGTPGHVQPYRMTRRRERGVGKTHAERLAHHLRSRRSPQKLAASPGVPQARQPISAAYSTVIWWCAKRAPMV